MLVFDGDCGFCTRSAHWLAAHTADPLQVVPYQALDLATLSLSEHDVTHYAWWLDGGRRARGHRAIARALLTCRAPWSLIGRLILLPPLSWLGAPMYRLIARYRGRLPGATTACRLPPPSP
jgi:predicted DCC family thiol-disulfide oxidoreductase YuxK